MGWSIAAALGRFSSVELLISFNRVLKKWGAAVRKRALATGILGVVFLGTVTACSRYEVTPPALPVDTGTKAQTPDACDTFLADPANDPANESQDELAKMDRASRLRWLERASEAVRDGKTLVLNNQDPVLKSYMERLLEMPRSEVLRNWMLGSEFDDAVLNFGMYVWGGKKDSIRDAKGEIAPSVYEIPSAIFATQSMFFDGRFLESLIDFHPPTYIAPVSPTFPISDQDKNTPDQERRDRMVTELHDETVAFITKLEETPPKSDAEFCQMATTDILTNARFTKFFSIGFVQFVSIGQLSQFEEWYVFPQCVNPNSKQLTFDPVARMRSLLAKDDKFLAEVQYLAKKYKAPKSPFGIWRVDLEDFAIMHNKTNAMTGVALRLQNSSTNMNRKRAAFVLQRFFCDNLTPINVENPTAHTTEAHGSQASCRSCHYKLDPMAGFFGKYGSQFVDYSSAKKLTFDDGAQRDLNEYLENWRDRQTGQWNVGYVRSMTHPELNSYGETPDDLFAIMRDAPEVKACMVQRMFDYFIGPTQSMDLAYRDYVVKEFTCTAQKVNSGEAFKRALTRILMSKTFSERNPESDRCYDFAPGGGAGAAAPPCRVAAVLQKNCVTCHDSTSSSGRLNLANWIEVNGEMTFPHVNRKGEQKTKGQTFARIAELLSTTDDDERMPKNRFMHPLEREKLFLWVQENLGAK